MGFREARIKAGMSVIEVKNKLGVSDASVYMWETGQTMPEAKKLVKIADLYGCTVDELLRGE